jgi:hypothetical protein
MMQTLSTRSQYTSRVRWIVIATVAIFVQFALVLILRYEDARESRGSPSYISPSSDVCTPGSACTPTRSTGRYTIA